MDVREIRDVVEWDSYADTWRRITSASPQATVFQTWEWNRTWWRHFGGGKRLWALAFVEDRTVVGFAPLFLPPDGVPLRIARFLGTGVSDYGDLLALPGCEMEVLAAFSAFLADRQGAWDWLDLQQIRPGAVAGLALPGNGPLRAATGPGETCPYLPLPSDWETFRSGLGKKLRSNIGYYERALRKLYAVDMRLATGESLEDDLSVFFELHQRRWNRRWLPGVFVSRRMRAFHQEVAAALLAAGFLRLHTLTLDGEAQASLYCFQFNRRCAYYLGGFEPTLARLSVGTVLTAQAIRHAIDADQATEFDFLRGDEPYKYRWGAQDRFSQRLSLTHPGLRPPLLAGAGHLRFRAEIALKRWMHRRHGGSGKRRGEGA